MRMGSDGHRFSDLPSQVPTRSKKRKALPAVCFLHTPLKGMHQCRLIPPRPMRGNIRMVFLSCPASSLQPANVVGMHGVVDLQKQVRAMCRTRACHCDRYNTWPCPEHN